MSLSGCEVSARGRERAAGPCVARHLASQLYGGEEAYLQVDAHTAALAETREAIEVRILGCHREAVVANDAPRT